MGVVGFFDGEGLGAGGERGEGDEVGFCGLGG